MVYRCFFEIITGCALGKVEKVNLPVKLHPRQTAILPVFDVVFSM